MGQFAIIAIILIFNVRYSEESNLTSPLNIVLEHPWMYKGSEDKYVLTEIVYTLKEEGAIKLDRQLSPDTNAFLTFTEGSKKCPYQPSHLHKSTMFINAGVSDIRRPFIYQTYKKHFGIDYIVNPLEYKGTIVAKPINTRHEIKLMDAPIRKTEPGIIYQKVVQDIQGPYQIKNEVWVFRTSPKSFQYYVIRSQSRGNYESNDISKSIHIEELFTQDQLVSLVEFLNDICLDFGKIDVIMDKQLNMPVIMDVIDTPRLNQRSEQYKKEIQKTFMSSLVEWRSHLNKYGYEPCKSKSTPIPNCGKFKSK